MNLLDLEQFGSVRGRTRVGAPIRDAAGETSHQVVIEGPTELVRAVFADADFDITIEPGTRQDDWQQRFGETLQARSGRSALPPDALGDGLFKPRPETATPDDTVVMMLQKTRPGGTGYILLLPFAVPRGASLFVVLPPVCSAAGLSLPTAGDPDLFLMLTPAGPTVAASRFTGLAPDGVSFSLPICLPLIGFLPFFRVLGFLASTGTLLCGGFALP